MNVTATTEQYDKHSNQILFFLIQKLKIFNAMLHFGDQIFWVGDCGNNYFLV